MNAESFLDTNILLYCFDKADLRKKAIARMLVEEAGEKASGVISYQVCQEFCNVILHKLSNDVPVSKLEAYLDEVGFGLIRVQPSTALFRHALRIHQEPQYRFYDSLIVAAAIESGASILYSEDLQHESRIGPLQIQNPFA